MFGRLKAWYSRSTNDLPLGVLAVYFLISMTESIPMTAFLGWLNTDIKMSQEQQSNFYAVIFLPWVLKPLFGYISDVAPIFGYHRKSYLVLCSLGSATCYILTATVVKTSAVAFVVVFIRAVFNAFAELMVGTFLVDVAHRKVENTGSIQSWGTASRNMGTLVASLITATMYTCIPDGHQPADRTVIGFTAVIPLICAIVSLYIPEERDTGLGSKRGEPGVATTIATASAVATTATATAAATPAAQSSDVALPVAATPVTRSCGFIGGMLALQILFVWLGLRDFFVYPVWWHALAIYGSCMVAALGLGLYFLSGSGSTFLPPKNVLLVGVFIFMYNVAPSASIQFGSYQYNVFMNEKCRLQYLGIIGSVSSIAASVSYGVFYNGKSSLIAVALNSVLAGALGLSALPFAQLQSPQDNIPKAFRYAVLAEVVQSFFGEFTMVPLLVMATEACPPGTTGTTYATFLSLLNLGDVISGLITAPIVAGFGITYTNWEKLPDFLYVCTASQCSVLVFVALLVIARRHDRGSRQYQKVGACSVNDSAGVAGDASSDGGSSGDGAGDRDDVSLLNIGRDGDAALLEN